MINNIAKEIIKSFNVNKFVETGIKDGETMNIVISWFCELFPDEFLPYEPCDVKGDKVIFEVDIDSNSVAIAQRIAQNHRNIRISCDNSPVFLSQIIQNNEITSRDAVFFFLDAHTPGVSEPLRNELKVLKLLNKAIIMIDDWEIPTICKDIYNTNQIKDILLDKTNFICYTKLLNFHRKGACIIFYGYEFDNVKDKLKRLPIIFEKF
jgi:hypothetical protein